MSCSPFDLKDFYFGELGADDRRKVETHVAACAACREELDALALTGAALMNVRDEEPPRRIAFVSDKVFQPTWWQRLWASGPQLGFASAAMLAGAILAHGVLQKPAAPITVPVAQVSVDQSQIESEIDRRVKAEVEKAMIASEARQMTKLLDAMELKSRQNSQEYREQLVALQEYLVRMQKRFNVLSRASYDSGVIQ